ncbi:MAG: phosphoglycerate kinase [Patescibacteria group bacterium]|nr:phosphoglycerate kinase [Patescibacteria group bacterium]
MQVKSVRDAVVEGRRVLLRVDFNVPLDYSAGQAAVADDSRIRAALPTIQLLLEKKAAKIILLSHLGRPGGKVVESLRVAPVFAHLQTLIDTTIIEMHENLRFNAGEEDNDSAFAQELASLGDVFVNDAFADSHRAHASIVGVPKLLPSYAGLLMEKEIEKSLQALTPQHPAIAIIGGAKFETKVPLLKKLASLYDTVLIGGALANDLLKTRGLPVGSSLVSNTPVPEEIAGNDNVLAPTDVALMDSKTHTGRSAVVSDTRAAERIVDVGPVTAAAWAARVARAQFVVWNGPLGVYEEGYVDATDALAEALAGSEAHAVVGGGDTLAALSKFTFDTEKIFLSTGGGAMLEFLAEGSLPGIEALKR